MLSEVKGLVAVVIGRPWRPDGALVPGVDFAGFDAPGFAKMALAFASDGASLATETRVLLTTKPRSRFRSYWLVVRPWSGIIRQSWLSGAPRRAVSPVSDGAGR